MLNMIGGVGAGSVTAGLLSQAPETWNPALYQLAVNVHDVAVKPLTSVVFTVVLYVRFIELYALTAFQSLRRRTRCACRSRCGAGGVRRG